MALAVATMSLLQGCERAHDPPTTVVQLARQARDLPAHEQQQLVDGFVRAHPTNPIIKGRSASFLVRSDHEPRLVGDFNGWGKADVSSGAMTQIGSTDWFFSRVRVPIDARLEYLVVRGSAPAPDDRNPRRVASIAGDASEVLMPRHESHDELMATGSAPAGVVEHHEIVARDETRTHHVAIYTPPAHDRSRDYPVVFFHDGTLMLRRGVPAILDALQAQGRITPLVAVFVDPQSRADDYKMSEEFRRFFLDELIPWVEDQVMVSNQARERAVIGVSRGAIAALDLALHAPEGFGGCGLLIPSFAPTSILGTLADGPKAAVRFAVVAGAFDREWLAEAQTLEVVLEGRGYDSQVRVVQEGHNVQTWRSHIDDVLVPFFGPEASR